jgi:hypothetical protein
MHVNYIMEHCNTVALHTYSGRCVAKLTKTRAIRGEACLTIHPGELILKLTGLLKRQYVKIYFFNDANVKVKQGCGFASL